MKFRFDDHNWWYTASNGEEINLWMVGVDQGSTTYDLVKAASAIEAGIKSVESSVKSRFEALGGVGAS